jgi:isoleucyl-tRNA synthetase
MLVYLISLCISHNELLLQYNENHVSKSIYAIFKITALSPASSTLLEEFLSDVYLAIWTTTPWTIPANAGKLVAYGFLFVSEVNAQFKFTV